MAVDSRDRTSSGSPLRESSHRTRPVAIRPGSSPFTRIPRGPSSSAMVLATPARPGRRPLEMASEGIGDRTDEDSTNAIEPPSPSSAPASRASRTAPRNTLSNAARQASSPTASVPPPGGPPTLISTPSRRPKASRDAASSRAAASGSPLSAVRPTAWPGPPRPAAASERAEASRALSTTRAPSAASAWAVASPRPRLPPVIRYTRSRRPRSIAVILPHPCPAGGAGRLAPSGAVADPAQVGAGHLLDLLDLGLAEEPPPAAGLHRPARTGPGQGPERDPGADELRHHAGGRGGGADHLLITQRGQLLGAHPGAQPGHLADRAAPVQRAPGGQREPRPGGQVGRGLQAEERVGQVALDVGQARPEHRDQRGVAEHAGDHVPAVPDDLHDPGVAERLDQALRAVHQVRAGVAVAQDVPLGDAGARAGDPARTAA